MISGVQSMPYFIVLQHKISKHLWINKKERTSHILDKEVKFLYQMRLENI